MAGKASHTIVLPSTLDELVFFLGDPVHRLVKLLVRIFFFVFVTTRHRGHRDKHKG